ncbi:transcription termination/antitermination protein NusG [Rhizobium sp. SGZ-381]|uniref:transcription termination/antitermination protein NusG n=1 Tax=Rhizobium sp. SGZ-381 TaxID=3342800 RepID=UPI00366FD392
MTDASIPNEGLERSAQPSQNRWYVVRIQPNQDVVAEGYLRQQSFRTFIPRTLKNIKHARKIEVRKTPLFPGYGFVEMDLERQRWRSINSTRGVLHLITARETPTPVPRGVVEEFLEFADADGIVDLSRGLAVGSKVRLRAGPFAGAIGLLTGLDEKGRVEVLLRIMNSQIRMKTAQDLLEAAGARASMGS